MMMMIIMMIMMIMIIMMIIMMIMMINPSFLFAGKFDRGQPRAARGPGWRGLSGRDYHRGPLVLDGDGLQDYPLPRLPRALRKKGK